MTDNLEEELKKKTDEVKELKQKLIETENKFNELNRDLEQRVINRTVEVNRLLLHKTKFVDNLAHDLGTPLTPLMALLPIIKEDVEKLETKELVDTCIRNVEYIKRVVRNSQKLAELSSTDLYLKKENLLELVNELQEKYDIVFKSCNINIQNNINEGFFVKTERPRLLEVLDHVSSNAVNSMTEGGTLTFEARLVEEKTGSFIDVVIRDTGVGLEREQTDHLFDEFYKADESRHKLDSTGLGLAICRRIIEKHGGKIWADSHGKGTGTAIHFTIPSA